MSNIRSRVSKLERDSEPPGCLTVGRLIQLAACQHDPELAAIFPPPTPAETLRLEEILREAEEQLAREVRDRAGLDHLTLRGVPALPQAGEGEQVAVTRPDKVRLLAAGASLLPFILEVPGASPGSSRRRPTSASSTPQRTSARRGISL